MEKEGTQDGPKTGGILSRDSDSYKLYFKGLVREETRGPIAGFGVAICKQEDDNLLFQMKGSLHDSAITVLEVELMALKRGLTEAVSLGIPHISICCDHDQIFELVLGRSVPEKDSIALLMNDVERIRQQLTSSTPVLVTGNQTKNIAYKLAMETLVSEISISMPPSCGMVCADDQKKKKLACGICFEEDFEAEQMFYVALCRHQFCVECMTRHVNRSLLEGRLMRCPRPDCYSKLTIKSCAHLLEPKIRAIWEQRIRVGSEETYPWRECKNCQHVNELKTYRGYVTCSCGYSFCNECGDEWKHPGCRHLQARSEEAAGAACCCTLLLVMLIGLCAIIAWLGGNTKNSRGWLN
ncbi:unnamed protein product [Thlaspi arvense]|uniref:RBR-type E3 ubiquitin transferase n=1 Tax=Thlaspi arvense TaxID=13288 RepID=A0AAU9SGW6_THLAR|nr:unnamed protein product [Thlaspi arvense]